MTSPLRFGIVRGARSLPLLYGFQLSQGGIRRDDALAVFFATFLSFDAGERTVVVFDLDDVLALAFLVFGVPIARFDDFLFTGLARFFMSSSQSYCVTFLRQFCQF